MYITTYEAQFKTCNSNTKKKKLHTLTEPNLTRSKKFLNQKINMPNMFKE